MRHTYLTKRDGMTFRHYKEIIEVSAIDLIYRIQHR